MAEGDEAAARLEAGPTPLNAAPLDVGSELAVVVGAAGESVQLPLSSKRSKVLIGHA